MNELKPPSNTSLSPPASSPTTPGPALATPAPSPVEKQKYQNNPRTTVSKPPPAGKQTSNRGKEQEPIESISMLYTNADSLGNKLEELKEKILITKPDIVAVNEVKHKSRTECMDRDYNMDLLNIYDMVTTNIESDVGRGQMMLFKKGLAKQVFMETKFSEATFLEVKLKKRDRAVVALIYRSESQGEPMANKLNTLITELNSKGYSHIVIMGDFNFRYINWETMQSTSSGKQLQMDTKFLECLSDNYLIQHVNEPTRWRGADKPSLIDLIITNEENMISDLEYDAPLGKSDHAVLTMKLNCYIERKVEIVKRKKYHLADYESMYKYFEEVQWEKEFGGKSFEEKVEMFQHEYEKNEEKCVPTVTKRGDQLNSIPVDTITADLIRKKTQLSRKVMNAKRRGSSEETIAEAKREYNKARNKVRNRTRYIRKTYEQKLADLARKEKNLKPIYAYMKRMSRTQGGIGDICINPSNPKSCKTSSIKKKVKIFSDYFASVWTQEPEGDIPTLPSKMIQFEMTIPEITPEDVKSKLIKLNPSKSCGPDNHHPRVLKETAEVIATPISIIYNESIQKHLVPTKWKESLISVLFKKGDKSLAGNYRPVSLTCILCKVLESILRDHFIDFMIRNNLFSDKQYGFLAGRSSTLQLLKVIDEWTEALDEGFSIDCIYMDFQKAFDTVPHKRLMSKLRTYGFNELMIEWITDFIVGRTQRVRIDGELSEEMLVISGIPQGTVLGPFLFLLYVNDLPELVNAMLYLFADDNKVYKIIQNPFQDRNMLQTDLDKIYEWSKLWLMKIHPDKLFGMEIGGSRDNPVYDYTVGPMIVRHSTQEKDIGVEIDDKLTYASHIDAIVKKANRMAGWLRRSFKFLTPTLFRPLYTAIVRMQVEYAFPVWNPYKQHDIDKIESVQMRATKMLPGFKEKSYSERLKLLNLPTLKFRRIRGDMITVYKMLSGKHARNLCPRLKLYKEVTGREGRHSKALYQERAKTDQRKYSFGHRVAAVWNTLPSKVVESMNVDAFKRNIDKVWKNEPMKFDYKECLSCVRVTRRK